MNVLGTFFFFKKTCEGLEEHRILERNFGLITTIFQILMMRSLEPCVAILDSKNGYDSFVVEIFNVNTN